MIHSVSGVALSRVIVSINVSLISACGIYISVGVSPIISIVAFIIAMIPQSWCSGFLFVAVVVFCCF